MPKEVGGMAKKSKTRTQKMTVEPKGATKTRGGTLTKYLPASILVVLLLVVALTYWQQQKGFKEALLVTETVKLETSQGTVMVEVYPKLMPTTVTNFLKLVGEGFYDGLFWHRVEDWVVQTGDPEGTGMGGSAETIALEVHKSLKNVRGALGMARTQDPDSASSQFYVLKTDASWLDGGYAVFGKVLSGMDIIEKLTQEDTIVSATVEPSGR